LSRKINKYGGEFNHKIYQAWKMSIEKVFYNNVFKKIGFKESLNLPESSLKKDLKNWRMDEDDVHILRYLYRNFKPKRHLEFGTWEGDGVLYVLEESDATVWTINLLEGELKDDGSWAYGTKFSKDEKVPQWANKEIFSDEDGNEVTYYQTDALGFIGRKYLNKGLGYRVCQIYCDSRDWDIQNYPEGFFDTVLIDGGHTSDIVSSDTRKALNLVRSGGLVIWHDYCPKIYKEFENTREIFNAIKNNWNLIKSNMQDIFWINPSWLLIGIRK
jgi:predicted O-methyltransferase YrrM